ncbi:WD repeat-containing protein 49 [Fasciola gigantica]|uniref:WD repeat-containing protein 49 n=1 Tax=Fasciola gigantica TaxID=46835 RepID=A0A504YSD1_FASGI|nr:WD repeat-containing protein 49 [Fasciola gigantica]
MESFAFGTLMRAFWLESSLHILMTTFLNPPSTRSIQLIITVSCPFPFYLTQELLSQWLAHVDLISGLALCTRFERRIFLVTSSTDCAINLWTLDGVKIGVFGQELRWKLDQIQRDIGAVSLASTETLPTQGAIETLLETAQAPEPKEGEDSTKSCPTPPPEFRVDNIEPFTENASLTETCNILSSYRVSAWNHTILGKEYQEMRLCKRQRKQPQTIPDLPYLHGERFGRQPRTLLREC